MIGPFHTPAFYHLELLDRSGEFMAECFLPAFTPEVLQVDTSFAYHRTAKDAATYAVTHDLLEIRQLFDSPAEWQVQVRRYVWNNDPVGHFRYDPMFSPATFSGTEL